MSENGVAGGPKLGARRFTLNQTQIKELENSLEQTTQSMLDSAGVRLSNDPDPPKKSRQG